MNSTILEALPGNRDISRTARKTAILAAIAVIALTLGTSSSGAASEKISVDCKANWFAAYGDKKIKLEPQQSSATFLFGKGCYCWKTKSAAKQFVEDIIQGIITKFKSDPGQQITSTFNIPWEKNSVTLDVPIGETRTAEVYCYPESRLKQIEEWGKSIVGQSSQ